MFPSDSTRAAVRHPPRDAGFTLVAAIFLLVVLAALGAFLVSVATTSETSADQYMERGRAYQAARAGLEWGMYELAASAGRCMPPTVLSTNAPTLADFRIQVACEIRPVSPAREPPRSNERHTCVLTSRATRSRPGAVDYVARELHRTVADCAVPAGEDVRRAFLSGTSAAIRGRGYVPAPAP